MLYFSPSSAYYNLIHPFFNSHYPTFNRFGYQEDLHGLDEDVIFFSATADKTGRLAQHHQFGARLKTLGHRDESRLAAEQVEELTDFDYTPRSIVSSRSVSSLYS